jgi:hypothetical protein
MEKHSIPSKRQSIIRACMLFTLTGISIVWLILLCLANNPPPTPTPAETPTETPYPINWHPTGSECKTPTGPNTDYNLVVHYAWETSTGKPKDVGPIWYWERVMYPGADPYSPPSPPWSDEVQLNNPMILDICFPRDPETILEASDWHALYRCVPVSQWVSASWCAHQWITYQYDMAPEATIYVLAINPDIERSITRIQQGPPAVWQAKIQKGGQGSCAWTFHE